MDPASSPSGEMDQTGPVMYIQCMPHLWSLHVMDPASNPSDKTEN